MDTPTALATLAAGLEHRARHAGATARLLAAHLALAHEQLEEIAELVVLVRALEHGGDDTATAPAATQAPGRARGTDRGNATASRRRDTLAEGIGALGILDAVRAIARHKGARVVDAATARRWFDEHDYRSRQGNRPSHASIYVALRKALLDGKLAEGPQRGSFDLFPEA